LLLRISIPSSGFFDLLGYDNEEFLFFVTDLILQILGNLQLLADQLWKLQFGVQIVIMSVDAPDASPVTPLERNANETPFVIGRDVENETVNAVEIEDFDAFAFVEPNGGVVLRFQRRHDDVDVVVAQAQNGFVRIDQIVRGEASANLVELSPGKRLPVLEEVVERVEGAHLKRLALVINAADAATSVRIHRSWQLVTKSILKPAFGSL